MVVAGGGPERERLACRASALGLEERVRFLGHVENVRALYAAADVFVLSSRYEGVPAVVLEALAAGLPIAATNCCVSMEWLLGYGRFGVTVPPGDADRLGLAMNAARHMRPDLDAMRRFAAAFTLESSSKRYLSRFAALAGDARDQQQNVPNDVRVCHGGGV